MSGTLDVTGNYKRGVHDPSLISDGANKNHVDNRDNL
jgi:hypothetical protein